MRTASEQTIALRPGKISEARFEDYTRPGLEIVKRNIANGSPIEGVTYQEGPAIGVGLDSIQEIPVDLPDLVGDSLNGCLLYTSRCV